MKNYKMDDSRKEQIRCIKYWWIERGDVERWSGWEKNKHNFLELSSLLRIKKFLNKTINHVIKNLGEENEKI